MEVQQDGRFAELILRLMRENIHSRHSDLAMTGIQ